MSIIGTRPPLISETNLYELHHRARLAIKPGITGMWQVSGRSDITDFEEVVRLDKEYITNWNIGLDELPEGVELPAGRTKPWGTGQAVLACKEVLHEPFAVINADDYYGKEAFVKLHDFLVGYTPEKANQFCMAGFILKNTLSENGAVTRGICETNEEGYLTAVHETSNIVKTSEGAAVDNDGQLTSINAESYASMNMWGLTPEFMQILEDGFKEFFANMRNKDIMKVEYLLPIYIDELLQAGRVSVKVLDTNDKWFGVTYKEDKDYVVKSFAKLIEAGVYQKNLFKDLK